MIMGLEEVVLDGFLILMSNLIGFGYVMIGLKERLGVGVGKFRIVLYNRGRRKLNFDDILVERNSKR